MVIGQTFSNLTNDKNGSKGLIGAVGKLILLKIGLNLISNPEIANYFLCISTSQL